MISKQEEKRLWKKIERVEDKIKDLSLPDKKRAAKIIKRNKQVRFPEHIDILGNSWKIELSENLNDSEEKKMNGLCHHQNRKISLCLSNKNIIQTLLHELQHSIDFEYGRCFDELRKLKGHFDEFRVSTLAQIWLNIFKQLKGEEIKTGNSI